MTKNINDKPVRPPDWNAHKIASKSLSHSIGVPVTANLQEEALVEAGATAIIEILRKEGIKVIVSTSHWTSNLYELKDDGSLGFRADQVLINHISDSNNIPPVELDKLEGYLILLPTHTLKGKV